MHHEENKQESNELMGTAENTEVSISTQTKEWPDPSLFAVVLEQLVFISLNFRVSF